MNGTFLVPPALLERIVAERLGPAAVEALVRWHLRPHAGRPLPLRRRRRPRSGPVAPVLRLPAREP
jgi:hypothetical protein